MLKESDIAPNFTLPTTPHQKLELASLRGKNVVLYFYPKDDTPGCTLESKDFAAAHDDFAELNTVIIGVSKDSIKSHDKFKDKYCLPFQLVSDETGNVCEQYGVWVEKSMYGKKYMGIERTTFLIGADGKIAKIWPKVKVEGHVKEVIKAVRAL
jgi:thioredoxin-dependent peroxiredoxin